MNFKSSLAALTVSLGTLAAASSANALILNETQTWTSGGQNFTFNFMVMPTTNEIAILTLHTQGDFDGGQSNEDFDWNIDGVISETDINHESTGSVLEEQVNGNIVRFTREINISALDLMSITADGSIDISIDWDSGVGYQIDHPGGFQQVTLKIKDPTAVSEPGTLALVGLGLAGLGIARRRRKV